MRIEDISQGQQYSYTEKCECCGLEQTMLTQKDDFPEYVTYVYLLCQCGEYIEFISKSISDASWGLFRQQLTYKAEYAGRKLGVVDPAYTSQTCSNCKHVEAKKLSQRKHSCCVCGYQDTRDGNASKNILALGLDSQQETARSSRLQARE